jgi:hypothetical protein
MTMTLESDEQAVILGCRIDVDRSETQSPPAGSTLRQRFSSSLQAALRYAKFEKFWHLQSVPTKQAILSSQAGLRIQQLAVYLEQERRRLAWCGFFAREEEGRVKKKFPPQKPLRTSRLSPRHQLETLLQVILRPTSSVSFYN